MRIHWPAETKFERVVLDVEEESCPLCGRDLHICDHRIRHVHSLGGPLELCCRLAHCSDKACPARTKTLSPQAELTLAVPGWLIAWDVFAFIGQRRFARHWSVTQLRDELRDSYRIPLSTDALAIYCQRYQAMVAARQQDKEQLRLAYQGRQGVVLSIDGLQPEKGHETLYAVRELTGKRVWFAQALLSSSQDEVNQLFVRARDLAVELGQPVRLWTSDKQDVFVKGIAELFPGVPHRYCQNHFLRGLAKPLLEADSGAKVTMRAKVRGLRDVERSVLDQRRQHGQGDAQPDQEPVAAEPVAAEPVAAEPVAAEPVALVLAEPVAVEPVVPGPATAQTGAVAPPTDGAAEEARRRAEAGGEVVLAYCAALRGILNDDQGGPLDPPGLRMADALTEVRESLGRNLALDKDIPAHGQMQRLANCIDRGLAAVADEQKVLRQQVPVLKEVAQALSPETGDVAHRRARFESLQAEYAQKGGEFLGPVAKMMLAWLPGLFAAVPGEEAGQPLPWDNLDLERFFRLPKGHERRIHGHRHAGVRIVQEGPSLLLTLNAHEDHPQPFTAHELLPYADAQPPRDEQEARERRKIMRKARSKKNGPSCSQT